MSTLEDIKGKYSRACSELDRLAGGNPGSMWRWSIPADPERDSDLILSDSLASIPKLVAALEAVEAHHQPMKAKAYDRSEIQICTTCSDDVGNWEIYPCPTLTSIGEALS